VWHERRHAPTEPENLKLPNEARGRLFAGLPEHAGLGRQAEEDSARSVFRALPMIGRVHGNEYPGSV
jgi:hypothetical protein